LFLSKGQGLEIGNWGGMQPLHKIYGLITYLTQVQYILIIKFSFFEF
jgi:hypothetical protein